jgi:hypothetical protein
VLYLALFLGFIAIIHGAIVGARPTTLAVFQCVTTISVTATLTTVATHPTLVAL